FARPGTPVIRQWPPVNSAMSTCSMTSSWPTMTLRSSASMRSRPSATRSALTVAAGDDRSMISLMRQRVHDLVDAHAVRHRGVLDVARIFLGVRPFPAVAHVGVPVDEHHRPAGVVQDRPQVRDEAAFLPAPSRKKRAEAGDLREPIELVEAAEDRVILRDLHDLAIGKDALDLVGEVLPFERTVEVVEHGGAAAQQEL